MADVGLATPLSYVGRQLPCSCVARPGWGRAQGRPATVTACDRSPQSSSPSPPSARCARIAFRDAPLGTADPPADHARSRRPARVAARRRQGERLRLHPVRAGEHRARHATARAPRGGARREAGPLRRHRGGERSRGDQERRHRHRREDAGPRGRGGRPVRRARSRAPPVRGDRRQGPPAHRVSTLPQGELPRRDARPDPGGARRARRGRPRAGPRSGRAGRAERRTGPRAAAARADAPLGGERGRCDRQRPRRRRARAGPRGRTPDPRGGAREAGELRRGREREPGRAAARARRPRRRRRPAPRADPPRPRRAVLARAGRRATGAVPRNHGGRGVASRVQAARRGRLHVEPPHRSARRIGRRRARALRGLRPRAGPGRRRPVRGAPLRGGRRRAGAALPHRAPRRAPPRAHRPARLRRRRSRLRGRRRARRDLRGGRRGPRLLAGRDARGGAARGWRAEQRLHLGGRRRRVQGGAARAPGAACTA